MLPPPDWANPYDLVQPGTPNPGTQGVVIGWDTMRQYWGSVINQAWADLDAIQSGGVLL